MSSLDEWFENNKPEWAHAQPKHVVHYTGEAFPWGSSALLQPVNHTNHVGQEVTNTKPVKTSTVISWNEETGVIETLNTCYVPLKCSSGS